MKCGAIIVAAGEGRRLQCSEPKAFVSLGGRPIYHYSLTAFLRHLQMDEIVLVIPPGHPKPALENVRVVFGGASRQESVACGLEALSPDCEGVLVHDAARPFLPTALIDRLVEKLREGKNAIAAIPVTDTIKTVQGDRIIETLDRAQLFAAQTPQACLAADLKKAFAKAREQKWQATDEAALLEKSGIAVEIVAGEPDNFKITTPEDLKRAEAMAARRERR